MAEMIYHILIFSPIFITKKKQTAKTKQNKPPMSTTKWNKPMYPMFYIISVLHGFDHINKNVDVGRRCYRGNIIVSLVMAWLTKKAFLSWAYRIILRIRWGRTIIPVNMKFWKAFDWNDAKQMWSEIFVTSTISTCNFHSATRSEQHFLLIVHTTPECCTSVLKHVILFEIFFLA